VLETQTRYLPDFERLSVLAATLFLAYALAQFIDIPGWELELQLPGLLLEIHLNIRTITAFLAAGLAASGTDWLLRDHPALKNKPTIQHCLLPALTALVIGFPLYQVPFGSVWWIIFTLGGLLLMLVLVAEYIVVDPEDLRYTSGGCRINGCIFRPVFNACNCASLCRDSPFPAASCGGLSGWVGEPAHPKPTPEWAVEVR
jgi:hypothetical protein